MKKVMHVEDTIETACIVDKILIAACYLVSNNNRGRPIEDTEGVDISHIIFIQVKPEDVYCRDTRRGKINSVSENDCRRQYWGDAGQFYTGGLLGW
jgi:hypothetical protein